MTPEPYGRLRPTVRVLLIDDAARTLLFRAVDRHGLPFWFPPGGGADAGEAAEATARRELREETGLAEVQLGPELWQRRVVARLGDEILDFRERWFLARVPAFVIDTSGFEELERSMIVEHRWWTVPELAATPDRLVPDDLAELMASLLHDGPPAAPLLFPDIWHLG